MAIEVKTATGGEATVASNGKANTALGLGIAGLSAALLGGGLNGLLGNGIVNTGNGAVANGECLVSKDQFYQTLLQQVNEQASRDIAVERRFASLESSLATATAVGECNRAAIQREFEVVDQRFQDEARYDDLALRYALCGTIKGDLTIPFSKLSMGVADKSHVIDTYEARPFREPTRCGGCGPYHGGF